MRGNMSARIAFIPKTTKRLSQASRLLVYKQGNNEVKLIAQPHQNTFSSRR